MIRRMPTTWVAALWLLAGTSAGYAANPATNLELTSGARIGIVNELDAEVTHFHASRHIENSYLKTYSVSWSVSSMLLGPLLDRLTQEGFVPVPLAASDDFMRSRESCFLNASLAKSLPKDCAHLYAQLAAAQHLSALILLGPGRNDATHSGGARHRELPEYLRGWCFVSGEGANPEAPQLLNLTELLLVGISTNGATLSDREWGGDGPRWSPYRAPPDLKLIPQAQLDQLQPQFGALLKHQAEALLAHLPPPPR
jgi:hypothetical protein